MALKTRASSANATTSPTTSGRNNPEGTSYTPRARLVTLAQAADWLGVSRQTLYKLIEDGAVERVHITPSISRIDLNSLHEKVEADTGLPTDRNVPIAAQMVTPHQVAKDLSVSITTVRSMVKAGTLRESVFSKRVRFMNIRAIDALVDKLSHDA